MFDPLLTKMCLTIWNIIGPVNIINHLSLEAKKDCKTTLTSTVKKVSFAQSYQNTSFMIKIPVTDHFVPQKQIVFRAKS